MKRIFLLFLLLLSALLPGRAQDLRRWSEGIPDWSGFRVADEADSASSYASFTLIQEKKTVRIQGVTYHYRDVTSGLLPFNSWVKASAMNDDELAVVRRDFDLMEYFSRAYRDELLFTNDKGRELERAYVARFRAAQEEARATGDYSKYALSPDPFDVSQVLYNVSERHLSESIGLFSNIPFGSQGRLVYPSVGLSMTLDFGRGRNGFQVEAGVGASLFRNRYVGLQRNVVPYIGVFAMYRRELFREGPWSFSVYGGPGYSTRLFDGMRLTVGGVSLCEGICADLYLGRSVILSVQHPEQNDRFLQLKLSLNQMYNAAQRKMVPSVNLTAAIRFQGSAITRRMP